MTNKIQIWEKSSSVDYQTVIEIDDRESEIEVFDD